MMLLVIIAVFMIMMIRVINDIIAVIPKFLTSNFCYLATNLFINISYYLLRNHSSDCRIILENYSPRS